MRRPLSVPWNLVYDEPPPSKRPPSSRVRAWSAGARSGRSAIT